MAFFISNCLLLFFLMSAFHPSQAFSVGNHKGISFQAVVKLPNSEYPTVSGISVNGRILSPNNCILREEEFTGVNLANGYLNLNIGNGTPGGYDPGFTMAQVMDNSSIKASLTCLNADGSVNNGVTSFDPSKTNGARKFRISFIIDSFPIVADFNMRSMAYAINAESLDGKFKSDFINVNNNQNLSQANVESIFNRYIKLDAVLNNFDNSGSATTNLGLGPLATLVPSGTADATTYLRGDGSWVTVPGMGGQALGGDLSGNLPNPVVEKIKGQSVTAAATGSGQVLRYDGSNWAPNFVTMFDLRSTVTGTQAFAGVGCLANQTLTWTAATDNLTCTNISLNSGQVSGLVSSATTDTTNATNITSGTLSSDRLPSSVTNALWTEAAGSVYRAAGNVGIGTTSPSSALTIGDGSTTDGSIMARGFGTVGTDGQNLSVSGPGHRMFWYSKKAAFRAGAVDTANVNDPTGAWWNDASIGNYSMALGLGNKASGSGTFAAGVYSNAIGAASVALGMGATTNGANSLALGSFALGNATNSVALGVHSSTYGNSAVAISTSASGNTIASGDYSIAMGYKARTGSAYVGSGGNYSMAIGLGSPSGSTPMVTGTSSVGIFMGDQSGVDISSNNVMAVLGGNLGIGTAAPSSLLEVAGTGKFTGDVNISSGTASSSTTTGALVVNGGVGVTGYIYADRLQAAAGILSMASVGTLYSSTSVTKNWPYSGANLGSTFTAYNSGPTDNTGAFFKMNVRNTAGNNQIAYIGSVSVTGVNSYAPALVFGQQADATSYNEQMRLDSTGKLGIGTTAPNYKLDVQGGDISASGSVYAAGVALTSDLRFKRDLALSKVL